jgi:D-alanine transaminase
MYIFLNGQLVPKEEAKISVFDRGFLFGDAVYEVIPVYGNKLFCFTEHVSRLNNSEQEWHKICTDVINKCISSGDKSVYIQITRGCGEREHLYNHSMTPTVFVMCNPLSKKISDAGISAITHDDIRWLRCNIKATTLLPNILLRQMAKETDGSYEAILINNGYVTEGAASNVFVVKDDNILTPPKDSNILPGITRDLLVKLMVAEKMPVYEKEVSEQCLLNAEEIWLTGSNTGLAPVVLLNGNPVGSGKPGRWWKQASQLFNDFISTYKQD